MKFLCLGAAFSTAALAFLPSFPTAALAQEPNYVCFMTTPSGQLVDLSNSLCASKMAQPHGTAKNDQAFIDEYQQQVMEYPDVRDNLLANIQQTPDISISQAKSICNDLKAGMSFEEIKNKQAEETVARASFVNAKIVNTLATKYYCPQMSPQ